MVAAPVSVLLPSTLAILRDVKGPTRHLHANGMAAELWGAKYSRGPLHMHRDTDGRIVILDDRRPWNDQVVHREASEEDGAQALDRMADAEGIRWDEEPPGEPIYPVSAP